MRIILDCNVIISAGLSDGACRRVFTLAIRDHFCFVSQNILDECLRTIDKPKFANFRWRTYEYVKILGNHSKLVNPAPSGFKLSDKNDAMYLDVACHVKADAIITGNKKHFPAPEYGGVKILSPRDFLVLYDK
ncbi:MAG: putative toxin-antitoxin system toxin component, PIN family [Nitrospinae bacterium]|nr:putative toxin-antitoxin system toxin component, PIN family [Nitrospinota bacterium]